MTLISKKIIIEFAQREKKINSKMFFLQRKRENLFNPTATVEKIEQIKIVLTALLWFQKM